MKKFDYKIVSFFPDEESGDVEDELKELGGMGWELVSHVGVMGSLGTYKWIDYIFKREIQESA